MYRKILFLAMILAFSWGNTAQAFVSSSANYQLERDSINTGGVLGSSSNYTEEDTIGELGTGLLASPLYQLQAGYQQLMSLSGSGNGGNGGNGGGNGGGGNGGGGGGNGGGGGSSGGGGGGSLFFGSNGPIMPADTTPPANVKNLKADYIKSEQLVRLTWIEPSDRDFVAVKIMRSKIFYPANPFDGTFIYEGSANQFDDQKIEDGFIYFYTVFSRDSSANYSSGALAVAFIGDSAKLGDLTIIPVISGSGIPLLNLTISDFNFIQNSKKIPAIDNQIEIDGGKKLLITIEAGKIPERVNTIIITVTDSEDSDLTYSFLLSLNEEGIVYEATIEPFKKLGIFPLNISIYNKNNQKIKEITAEFVITTITNSLGAQVLGLLKGLFKSKIFWLTILILVVILLLLMTKREKRKKEDLEKNNDNNSINK